MFTGIIEGTGTITSLRRQERSAEIQVAVNFTLDDVTVGDSVAVNGCCLTVTSRLGHTFWANISFETLEKTKFFMARQGDAVNIERPLRVGDRLGGHLVQGHVDGVGSVLSISEQEGGTEIKIEFPHNLSRYIVDKGSITIDGVSLTANHCVENTVTVCIIPHTGLKSTFGELSVGSLVNLEVDVIGKYVEKMAFMDSSDYHQQSNVTREFLKKHGF